MGRSAWRLGPRKISTTEEEEEGRAMVEGGGWGTTTKGMMYVDSVFYGGVGKKKIITTTGFDRSGSLKSEVRGSPGVVPCGWRKCGGEK